jgi:hypothetical protein
MRPVRTSAMRANPIRRTRLHWPGTGGAIRIGKHTLSGLISVLDSTRRQSHHSLRARSLTLLLATVLGLAGGAGWLSARARADGDPASDVLATQALFLPQDAGLTAAGQTRLEAELEAVQQAGVPVRMAVIASSTDLGSVTALWRQPEA